MGQLISLNPQSSNLIFEFSVPFAKELKPGQSVSHNGVCLTVISASEKTYKVEAVKETLEKTNLKKLQAGDWVNVERCPLWNDRIDGHIVQGHVDDTAELISIQPEEGSSRFRFSIHSRFSGMLVDKGSVCLNGVSLTVISPENDFFDVVLIPHTLQETNFRFLKIQDRVY